MALRDGERQVAPELSGIRADHVARYRWAAARLPSGSRVLDLGCGVGYGASILADAGHTVIAIDRCREAIAWARQHFDRPGIDWRAADFSDAEALDALPASDVAVCFEILEHLPDPGVLLARLRACTAHILASVPNEAVLPFRTPERVIKFHHRHYTRSEFDALLERAGYRVTSRLGQRGPYSEVEQGMDGRTLVAEGVLAQAEAVATEQPLAPAATGLKTVAILGLGPSLEQYVDQVKRRGGRRSIADEIWGINSLGDVVVCDRVFHMDDVRIQEARAAANPASGIGVMLDWMRRSPGPIVTSRAHPGYPGLVEFPLEAVINRIGYAYFNSTAAYAVAYAILIGVKKILLFGIDFTYPDAHHAEKGRGCVEFWLGLAAARGIELAVAQTSTLMDANVAHAERFYGYDTVDVAIDTSGPEAKVVLTERALVPTAAEIEERYDHSRHPAGELAEVRAA